MHLENAISFLSKYDAFILDYDGVLENVHGVIKGGREFLHSLEDSHKMYCIMSNMSYSSRAKFQEHVTKVMGIEIPIERIFLASYLASLYITSLKSIKSVYLIGSDCIKDELTKLGIEVYGGSADNPKRMEPKTPEVVPFHSTDAVLVAYDGHFNMFKIYSAYYNLQRGAKLFVTNMDPYYKAVGKLMPDTGSWLNGLKYISDVEPIVCGKPSKIGYDIILSSLSIKKEKAVMIGDSLKTDILGANNAGIDSCLMLGGISTESDIEQLKIKPTYILSKLT